LLSEVVKYGSWLVLSGWYKLKFLTCQLHDHKLEGEHLILVSEEDRLEQAIEVSWSLLVDLMGSHAIDQYNSIWDITQIILAKVNLSLIFWAYLTMSDLYWD